MDSYENFEFLSEKEILDKAKPLEYSEKVLLDSALKKLGEIISVKEKADFLGISKGSIYKYIDE